MRFAVLALALALAGCAGSGGTPAGPVTIGGTRAVLLDADPCEWNGDSGCGGHSLGGSDISVCLSGRRSLAIDAGAAVSRISVSAGKRGDSDIKPKGRIPLSVRRIDGRHFSIALPGRLAPDLRVLHVDVRYRGGVITPYRPYSDQSSVGGDPRPFKRGAYAVRIRTRPLGDCAP